MTHFQLPPFAPLDASRTEFLNRRAAGVIEAVPSFTELRGTLLSLGGIDVVPPAFDPSSEPQRARQHYDVHQVLRIGRTWASVLAEFQAMETSNCHRNVAQLRISIGGQIASGWALAADGLWREHSWLARNVDRADESLVETTAQWLLYHGYLLNDEETGWFIRAELGPNAWPERCAEQHAAPVRGAWTLASLEQPYERHDIQNPSRLRWHAGDNAAATWR